MRLPLVLLALLALLPACSHTGRGYQEVRLLDCAAGTLKVHDGDTISCNGELVRILGIDTPEIRHERFGMMEDQPFGPEATAFAGKLLRAAARVTVLTKGQDRYGRTLGHVIADGTLFGTRMLEAGLAYETISFYGDNGFSGFGALLVDAASRSPQPQFENPYEWRRRMRAQPQQN